MARKDSDTSNSETCRVYAYYGADDARKRTALERLAAEIVDPDFRDFDSETLYGPDVTADRLILASSVAPLASKRRLVVVTQANNIPTAEQQALAGRLELIPASACVVFVTSAPRMQDGKPKRGSEIHADLMKAIRKAGKAIDFAVMKADPAVHFVHDLVKQAGKSIAPSVAASVVRRCGTDSGVLATEVEKLTSFVGDRTTVTDADVQQVTTQTVEEKIFSLMGAVGSKNPERAIHHLRPLFQGGGAAQGDALRTLVMLARHFRQIWQARLLIDAGCREIAPGKVPDEVEALLPQENSILRLEDWKRKKLFAQARNFTLNELARCFERIAAVDLAIKGIDGAISNPMMALEVLVIDLSSRQDSKKGRAYAPSH